MGCSAGKPLSTSPEISTSTQHSTLIAATCKNEKSFQDNGLVDIKQSSNTSTISNSNSNNNGGMRKDSKTIKSHKTAETADSPRLVTQNIQSKTRPAPDQVKPEREKENGVSPKRFTNTKNNRCNSSENPPIKSVPLGQVKVQLTQSQADFFTMLDKKIEEGEDYKSDCER